MMPRHQQKILVFTPAQASEPPCYNRPLLSAVLCYCKDMPCQSFIFTVQMRKALVLEPNFVQVQCRLSGPESKPQAHDWGQQNPPAEKNSCLQPNKVCPLTVKLSLDTKLVGW